jgi:hypothetical protein
VDDRQFAVVGRVGEGHDTVAGRPRPERCTGCSMPTSGGFSIAIDHGWMVQFVEHRIADRRVVRLIQKWLNAGVLEDGARTRSDEGTPQGGSISPLLANVGETLSGS